MKPELPILDTQLRIDNYLVTTTRVPTPTRL
jgi:hypothetical protein